MFDQTLDQDDFPREVQLPDGRVVPVTAIPCAHHRGDEQLRELAGWSAQALEQLEREPRHRELAAEGRRILEGPPVRRRLARWWSWRWPAVAAAAAACVAVLALAGCGTTGDALEEHPALVHAAVTVATQKFIDQESTTAGERERAERTAAIAGRIAEALRGGLETTLEQVEEVARDAIPWEDLDAGESALVEALIATVRAELDARIEDDQVPLDPEERVRVARVFEWIESSAQRWLERQEA